MLFEGMPDRLWKEGEKRVSKMVFIGRDLDRDLIREGFEGAQCLGGTRSSSRLQHSIFQGNLAMRFPSC